MHLNTLNCEVTTCAHNCDHCCCKGEIIVDGSHATKKNETCCGSFHKLTDSMKNQGAKYPDKELQVGCEAEECVYNKNHLCTAKHIQIAGTGASHPEQTLCETFQLNC